MLRLNIKGVIDSSVQGRYFFIGGTSFFGLSVYGKLD